MSKVGFVYVFRHPEFPNRFKVGQTSDRDERLSQLNSETTLVGKHIDEGSWLVEDCAGAELAAHEALRKFRVVPNREYFDCSLLEIHDLVGTVVKRFGLLKTEGFGRVEPDEDICFLLDL